MSFWSNLFKWGQKPKPPVPQANPYRPVAIVTVVDATVKLDGVPVIEGASAPEGTTNQDGYYCWTHVPKSLGATHVWVTADGYEAYDQHVDLTSGDQATQHDLLVGGEATESWHIVLPPLTKTAVDPVDPVDPVTPSSNPLVGVVRRSADKRGLIDDTGYVNPVFVHAGDLLSQWTHGNRDHVKRILDTFVKYGYHGVRTWTVLQGSYWVGYECGPYWTGDQYWKDVQSFAAELKERKLQWLVSQGDLLAKYRTMNERRWFMETLANLLKDTGVVFAIDAGNETFWNGEDDPNRLQQTVDAYLGKHNVPLWSLTSAPTEEVADINKTDGSIFDVHGYRGGHYWDKIRHIFSIPYEGKPDCRLGIQSEPFGPGELVSVTDNKDELTWGVEVMAGIQSLLSRQIWVYFCGPGVKSDATSETFESMPGFKETPSYTAKLPKDLMTFSTLCHGGDTWRGTRVFAVPGGDETRADHAIANDGRFVCILYGPNWKNCRVERDYDTLEDWTFGQDGRVVVGRIR